MADPVATATDRVTSIAADEYAAFHQAAIGVEGAVVPLGAANAARTKLASLPGQTEKRRDEILARRDIEQATKQRLLSDLKAEAEQAVESAEADWDAAETVLEALVQQRALPQVDRSRESLLRDETRMLFDQVPPGELPDRLLTFVRESRRRDLVALVASEWGESYLASRGVEDAAGTLGRARRIAAIVSADDPTAGDSEKRASAALRRLDSLRKSKIAGVNDARLRLDRLW